MFTIFVVCAGVGGTILVCQMLMTVLGLAGDTVDVDLPDDVDAPGDLDFGGDVDVGGDLDVGADIDADVGADADAGGEAGHDTSWLFGVLSFRTLVAAVTFFGLGGWAAEGAGFEPVIQVVIALAAGVGAMYLVYWLMRMMYSLKAEGTVRIGHTVGRHGTVYLRIPGERSGAGKVQLSVQKRTMEYLAMTSGEALPTGAKVRVVKVITSDTVEVEPVLEPERTENV
jgi:hypothetical protein